MGRDGHMLWERVEPPYHWKTTGLYIVADRHLNDGTRQHMVEGHVEPGCVRAGELEAENKVLKARVSELESQLEAVGAGGVESLRKKPWSAKDLRT